MFGCPRIAQQINNSFAINIEKDVVRRVLAVHYRPEPGGAGPSWLTFLRHTNDSLWSIDLFRSESIRLKSHWVLVIMGHFSRRCTKTRTVIGTPVLAGVLSATFFTLFVVPVACDLLARHTGSPNRVRHQLDSKLASSEG